MSIMLFKNCLFLVAFFMHFSSIESISVETILKIYCEYVKCEDQRNIICETKGLCTPAERCFPLPLDINLRKLILHKFNTLRSKIATGKETKYGNSQAANMFALSYDSEIEFVSQCNINLCNTTEETCFGTSEHPLTGRIYGSKTINANSLTLNKSLILTTVEDIFDKWADGVKKGNAESIDNLPEITSEAFRIFAQMVWAIVRKVGCGLSVKKDDHQHNVYFHCRFNLETDGNKSVYQRGKPCSKCQRITFFDENEQCSTKYEGLCGEPKIDMTWINLSYKKHSFYLLIIIFNFVVILII